MHRRRDHTAAVMRPLRRETRCCVGATSSSLEQDREALPFLTQQVLTDCIPLAAPRIVTLFETSSCVLASAADATVGVKNTAILQSYVCDNTGAHARADPPGFVIAHGS